MPYQPLHYARCQEYGDGQKGKWIYIKVNTEWDISEGDTEIYLNLINPPYSAYAMKNLIIHFYYYENSKTNGYLENVK